MHFNHHSSKIRRIVRYNVMKCVAIMSTGFSIIWTPNQASIQKKTYKEDRYAKSQIKRPHIMRANCTGHDNSVSEQPPKERLSRIACPFPVRNEAPNGCLVFLVPNSVFPNLFWFVAPLHFGDSPSYNILLKSVKLNLFRAPQGAAATTGQDRKE